MGGRQLPHAGPLQHRLTLCPPSGSRTAVVRAVPWRFWRARLEADGGGLENRYGAEASSWVRIPRPPLGTRARTGPVPPPLDQSSRHRRGERACPCPSPPPTTPSGAPWTVPPWSGG